MPTCPDERGRFASAVWRTLVLLDWPCSIAKKLRMRHWSTEVETLR